MKISQEELSKKIQEYIDDSYAFGDSDMVVTENVLKSISMLNEMEKGIDSKRLSELAENSNGESKNIIKDFILYMESM
jgi:fructose 1,6-bisphosphatase